MAIDRPTFSESWYRVEALTPRLLTAVEVHRQHFRGRKWYVLQDPANNQFFRLSDMAYHFVAILDGRQTVNQAWRVCAEKFGDAAPTQGEVINLLGRLHASNLLQGNVAPDAEELFRRYDKRIRRQVTGFLTNFLFIRIPVWDPDRFLDVWVGFFGRLFTWRGFLLWAAIVVAGLWSIAGHIGELAGRASGVLNPENLPLLYVGLVIVKVFHEMGHAFACKHFGKQAGTGGEVHQMGVTFLVFTPLPFMDASSAWALRNKRHRAVVGASGILVELVIASIAAILWTRTAEGTTIHAIAYNIMFIASVSTLLFNGNPFLRYDAYYILSDVLEIPNLDSRSKLYICYLVKRYIWGVQKAYDPSHTKGEKAWLTFYAVTAFMVRMIVMSAIIIFVGTRLFIIGVILAAAILAVWLLVPVGKMVRYVATSQELVRVRARAAASTLAAGFFFFITVGLFNSPDRCRLEGVVEAVHHAAIHQKTAGFVRTSLSSNAKTGPDGPLLITASSPELETRRDSLLAELRRLEVRRQIAQTKEAAAAQIIDEEIVALQEQIERANQGLQELKLRSPVSGTWVAPDIDRTNGMYFNRGRHIGDVVSLDNLRIRAIAGQKEAARLIKEAHQDVEIRVKGRPDIELDGRLEMILPAGHEKLPSAALGYTAGGSTQNDLQDPSGKLAAEPFFEILVVPTPQEQTLMRPRQRVVLRFETMPKPLIVQGWRALLQLFQARFQV